MHIHKLFILFVLTTLLFSGCSDQKKKNAAQKKIAPKRNVSYRQFVGGVFKVDTYDGDRILETGYGFMLNDSIAACPYSLFSFANRAVIMPYGKSEKYNIEGFVGVDRINNIILLKVKDYRLGHLKTISETPRLGIKTIIVGQPRPKILPLQKGKFIGHIKHTGRLFYKISNHISKKKTGIPIFYNGKVIGMGLNDMVDYASTNLVIPAKFIMNLYKVRHSLQPLSSLRGDEATSRANAKIKGLRIETEVGNITIRLYNETPAYRDNFIRLTKENYYDSLLIHRIIKGFGIQSGAADTRYATADDIVGWKGPGYTIPAHIHPSAFHRRGMIGSPRKPDTKNKKRRSDGSQFYIVSGRKYTDDELNDIEKENNHKFTSHQRMVYKTEGGAPHLDGAYTIFGEVLSGMEVVDALSLQPTQGDFRPLADIRIIDIKIIK